MPESKPVARPAGPELKEAKSGSSRCWQSRHITQGSLEDIDVLGALLSPVRGVRAPRAVAQELIAAFGSLGAVLGAPEHRLAEHLDACVAEHLGWVHAAFRRSLRERIRDRPIIGSWQALEEYLLLSLRHETSERLMVLFLDKKNGLIADERLGEGTVDHVPTYPREVAKRCVQLDASAIIMVHNHPSGDATPSRNDVDMTRQVIAALAPLGIAVHDHAIVGRNDVVSLRAQRLL